MPKKPGGRLAGGFFRPEGAHDFDEMNIKWIHPNKENYYYEHNKIQNLGVLIYSHWNETRRMIGRSRLESKA